MTIREKATLIDQFADSYNLSHKRKNFPQKLVGELVRLLFPGSSYLGHGAFKYAYRISSRKRDLVLKVGRASSISRDLRTYKRLPLNIRNRYFAKIYWRTKYTMLQKFGKNGNIHDEDLAKLRKVAKRHGLSDIGARNVKRIDGKFKIVDAL